MSANPSPVLAALLSFLFPGVGQIYAGEVRKGVIWAIPMLVFVIGVLFLLLGGTNAILGLIGNSQTRMALLVLNVAFFLYHLAAMLDAYAIAQRERSLLRGTRSGAAPVLLAALVALTLVFHGVPEAVGIWGNEWISRVLPGNRDDVIPPASFEPLPTPGPTLSPTIAPPTTAPTSPGGSPSPSGSPLPGGSGSPGPSQTPRSFPPLDPNWQMGSDGRVNILLVGSDSRSDDGVSAASLRTDSMMLLSVEVTSGKAALFSFPRNMTTPGPESRYPPWFSLPMPEVREGAFPNNTYPGLLNALWKRAAESPGDFPGSEEIGGSECAQQFDCIRGWRALVGTIQAMAGVEVDGIIAVNLKGFVGLVDNLPEHCPAADARVALTDARCYGGVWLDIPSRLQDDRYHTSTQQPIRLDIKPGCQFFDGEMTLAYSRSRHQDSDYQRSRRQQYVLTQIRRQLDPLGLLPHIPALLQVASANLFTTIDDSDIQPLAQIASRVDADRIYRYDFAPGQLNRLGSMQGLRDKVRNIFSEPEPSPRPTPIDERCPPAP